MKNHSLKYLNEGRKRPLMDFLPTKEELAVWLSVGFAGALFGIPIGMKLALVIWGVS